MEEKYMVSDVLEVTKGIIKEYEGTITETTNMELRQMFQNFRNSLESFQYEISKLAESKGYSTPEPKASQDEILKVRKEFLN
jgi:spore coat protein CotF